MTIESEVVSSGYTANGAQTVFTYGFRILSASHLQVYLDNVLQVAGYTVQNVDNVNGGTVTFASPPAAGAVVVLRRRTAITQPQIYVYPSAQHERSLDRLTMLAQENAVRGEGATAAAEAAAASAAAAEADANAAVMASGTAVTTSNLAFVAADAANALAQANAAALGGAVIKSDTAIIASSFAMMTADSIKAIAEQAVDIANQAVALTGIEDVVDVIAIEPMVLTNKRLNSPKINSETVITVDGAAINSVTTRATQTALNDHTALESAHNAANTPAANRIARFTAQARMTSGAKALNSYDCVRLTDLGAHIGETAEGTVGSYHFLAYNVLGAAISNQLYDGATLQRVGLSFDASGNVKSGFAGVATMLGWWQPMGSVLARTGFYAATVFKRVS